MWAKLSSTFGFGLGNGRVEGGGVGDVVCRAGMVDRQRWRTRLEF